MKKIFILTYVNTENANVDVCGFNTLKAAQDEMKRQYEDAIATYTTYYCSEEEFKADCCVCDIYDTYAEIGAEYTDKWEIKEIIIDD